MRPQGDAQSVPVADIGGRGWRARLHPEPPLELGVYLPGPPALPLQWGPTHLGAPAPPLEQGPTCLDTPHPHWNGGPPAWAPPVPPLEQRSAHLAPRTPTGMRVHPPGCPPHPHWNGGPPAWVPRDMAGWVSLARRRQVNLAEPSFDLRLLAEQLLRNIPAPQLPWDIPFPQTEIPDDQPSLKGNPASLPLPPRRSVSLLHLRKPASPCAAARGTACLWPPVTLPALVTHSHS